MHTNTNATKSAKVRYLIKATGMNCYLAIGSSMGYYWVDGRNYAFGFLDKEFAERIAKTFPIETEIVEQSIERD